MPTYKVTSPTIYVEAKDADEAVEIGVEHIEAMPRMDYIVELVED